MDASRRAGGGGNRCAEAAEDGKWDLFVGTRSGFYSTDPFIQSERFVQQNVFHISFITAICSRRTED